MNLRATWGLLALLICTSGLSAAELSALRQNHPWGRFRPGAWKGVRVTVENLDLSGKVTSRTVNETKTTLDSVDDEGVVLRIESSSDIGGKQIPSEVQVIKQTFAGVPVGQPVQVKRLEDETITIEKRQLACQVQQLDYSEGQRRKRSTIYYSNQVTPFILRSRTTLVEEADQREADLVSTEVIALDRPIKVLGKTRNAAHIKVTQHGEGGVTVTDSYNVGDVPGGEVMAWSTRTDPQGHVLRKTTIELRSYGFESLTSREDTRLPHRRERHRKRSS